MNPQVQSAPFSLEMVSVLLVDVLPLAVLEGELELEPALQAATPSTPATMMTPYLMRRLMVSSLLLFPGVWQCVLHEWGAPAADTGLPLPLNLLGQYPNYLSGTRGRNLYRPSGTRVRSPCPVGPRAAVVW